MDILDKFEMYLEKQGYSKITPSGHRSTTYDYAKARIPKICEREGITIQQLAENILLYIQKYDTFGEECEFGNKSNRAFINSLKRFQEFIKSGI